MYGSVISEGMIRTPAAVRPVADVIAVSDSVEGISVLFRDGSSLVVPADPGDIFSLADLMPWARLNIA